MRYYDLQKVGAFSGAHSFQKVAKSPLKWLKSQDVYTLHKPVRRRFPRRKNNSIRSKFSNAGRSY